ncbi:MAG: 4Fe-4S binding protein [Tannerella sp.]|nr:4Fe-4S binding protein [Tannerella sp.]
MQKIRKEKRYGYLSRIIRGICSLVTGLRVTFVEFFTKKTTEEYPDNRATLVMFDRFRGTLVMPHDEAGKNKCIACGLCESACPNDTLRVETGTAADEESGKKKKILLKYEYDLSSCMFCQLCVNVCPTKAIRFDTAFEHAVYTKKKLVKILNAGNKVI